MENFRDRFERASREISREAYAWIIESEERKSSDEAVADLLDERMIGCAR
jgi:hypothetical protein